MRTVSQQTPYGETIFCDDIREELHGKLSLIGLYRGKLIVYRPLPVTLPKFAMLITYSETPGESSSPVELRINAPWDEENSPLLSAQLPVEQWRANPIDPAFSGESARITLVNNVTFPNFTVKSEGFLRVRAYRDDLEIRLGSLLLTYQPPQSKDQGSPT